MALSKRRGIDKEFCMSDPPQRQSLSRCQACQRKPPTAQQHAQVVEEYEQLRRELDSTIRRGGNPTPVSASLWCSNQMRDSVRILPMYAACDRNPFGAKNCQKQLMFMGDSNGTNVVQDLGYPSIGDIVSSFLMFAISYGHQDSVQRSHCTTGCFD